MKRKIISMLTVIFMLFSMLAFAAEAASINISVGSIADGKADVTVSVSGNSGINNLAVELEFESTKLSAGTPIKGAALGDTAVITPLAGKISYSWSAAENKSTNGILFTVPMSIISGSFSETPLSITTAVLKSKGSDTPLAVTKGTSKITLAAMDFTFEDKTVTYNGQLQPLTAANIPVGAAINYQNNTNKDKGTYEVTAVLTKSGFTTVTKKATLVIQPSLLTITIPKQQKQAGDPDPEELVYEYEGPIYSHKFTGNVIREEGEAIGIYKITRGTLAIDPNFDISFTDGEFEIIAKEPQRIEISEISPKSYGDEPFRLTVSSDKRRAMPALVYESNNPAVAEVSADGTVAIKGTGDVTFKVTEPGNEVFADAVAEKTIRISKKVVPVKTEDIVAVYGDVITPSVTFGEFAFGEDETVLSNPVTVTSFTRPDVGTHDIILDGAEAENYHFSYTNAKLFVSEKNISVSNIQVFDKEADGTDTATIKNSSVTLDGALTGDSVSLDLSKAVAKFAVAAVSDNIKVTISNLVLKGRDAENYKLTNTTFETSANIKGELSAEIHAEQINVVPIEKDENQLTVPTVPANYRISIKSSTDPDIISTSGKISPVKDETIVNLVFTVTNVNNSSDTADTAAIPFTVPASTVVKIETKVELNGRITGGGDYLVNEKVTITAIPDDGYKLYCIRDEEGNVTDESTITTLAQTDKVFTAEFTKKSSSLAPVSQVVANIRASVSSGSVSSGTTLILSTLTPGATIYYTTNGETPNMGSMIFTDEIIIDRNMTVKAVAVKSQHSDSAISTLHYTTKKGKTQLKANASGIKYLSAKNNRVRPDVAATRYEVVDALSQLFDIQKITLSKTLSDVDPEYKPVVELFLGAGILDGYPDGTFGGNRGITRAEFVKILSIMLDLTETSGTVKFNDVKGHWAEGYIKQFADKKYINGYPDGNFQPDSNISRAEVVTVINRIAKTKKVTMGEKYEDLPLNHWAFDDMMNIVK